MDTLRAHKMRSALTVFGVVLGVSVIMLVAGLLSGFDQKIQEQIKQFGADTAFVSKWDQGRHGGPPPLEISDFQTVPTLYGGGPVWPQQCLLPKKV